MKLASLPLIERSAIHLLLQGNTILLRQLEEVESVHRTESGAGIYVVFNFGGHVDRLENGESFYIDDVFATSSDCSEIQFIIFIKDGLIEYLEGYTYEDSYPSYEKCSFTLSRQAAE